jgi:DNA polymerase-4
LDDLETRVHSLDVGADDCVLKPIEVRELLARIRAVLRLETSDLASRIKQAVRAATGLTCSICVAPNKLLAKIGSELDKPDGLTLLTPSEIPSRIWPLPARKVNGIGPKATEKLASLGIATVGDLARADPGMLQENFGRSYSEWLARAAQGHDERPVVVSSEPKSISRETTFERDLHPRQDRPTLSSVFTELCTRVSDDLRRKGYLGRTIGIKLRYANFDTVTRDVTLPDPTADGVTIRRAATECLKRVRLDRKLRLLGVRVTGLESINEHSAGRGPVQGELPFAEDDHRQGVGD